MKALNAATADTAAATNASPRSATLGVVTSLPRPIDYYDAACHFGSEDPSDEAKTTRVLTILLPEDY